ncbi:MAG: uroporphyrinogen-III synthase [Ginsengibacter sp.]
MQKNKVSILSTRPVGKALVGKAAQHDIAIAEVSFINTSVINSAAIAQKIHGLISKPITAIFTSMNAAEAVAKFLFTKPSWKIFCTGTTTKKIIEEMFGKESICATADGAELLADKILGNASIKNVVFFCGDQRREELPARLINNGIGVEEVIVYKTIETPTALAQQYDAILFFSPSAVKSFFTKNSIAETTQLFAIGNTTAAAAQPFTKQAVIISGKPGKESLVNLAIEHFSKTNLLNATIKK